MLNKILVFWGLALAAILIVENTVIWSSGTAYIFLWYSTPWNLVITTLILWMIIWYWIKSFFIKGNWDDDNYDF